MLEAMYADPTGKKWLQVKDRLPLTKFRRSVNGPNGSMVVTTFHYKGKPLVRFTRPDFDVAGQVVAGSVALDESAEDTTEWATVEMIEEVIAGTEAMDWEIEAIEMEMLAQMAAMSSLASHTREGPARVYAAALVAGDAGGIAYTPCESGAVTFLVQQESVWDCIGKTSIAIAAAGTAKFVVRDIRGAAAAAYAVAISTAGAKGAVATAAVMGWWVVGAAAVVGVGYTAYEAYDCYSKGGTQQNLLPAVQLTPDRIGPLPRFPTHSSVPLAA